MSTSPIAPPIAHAVLIPAALDYSVIGVPFERNAPWEVLYANGDLAKAREVADEWARANPGLSPVVMAYVDHCHAATECRWARP